MTAGCILHVETDKVTPVLPLLKQPVLAINILSHILLNMWRDVSVPSVQPGIHGCVDLIRPLNAGPEPKKDHEDDDPQYKG